MDVLGAIKVLIMVRVGASVLALGNNSGINFGVEFIVKVICIG